MGNFNNREKLKLEKFLQMESGYVLDFSNNKFRSFIMDSINLDIYADAGYEEYSSKANKLRQIWRNESDYRAGKLLKDLLDYFFDKKSIFEEELEKKEQKEKEELYEIAERLLKAQLSIKLPIKSEETLQVLLKDIQSSLEKNIPSLVLDRLHTFSVNYLRKICIKYKIPIEDSQGNKIALHGLAGKLKKHYQKEEILQSNFSLLAIQNSISLFDSFNDVRNDKSYAHDNIVLNDFEAEFVVRAMANVLTFLDQIEKKIESKKEKLEFDFSMELPF